MMILLLYLTELPFKLDAWLLPACLGAWVPAWVPYPGQIPGTSSAPAQLSSASALLD